MENLSIVHIKILKKLENKAHCISSTVLLILGRIVDVAVQELQARERKRLLKDQSLNQFVSETKKDKKLRSNRQSEYMPIEVT